MKRRYYVMPIAGEPVAVVYGSFSPENAMTTYYHVAPATYQDGDDLICLVRRANGNYELAARYARRRWPEYPDYAIGPDAHLVSLYESRTDASDHAGTHGGVVLEIDGAYLDLVRNSEGFPAVHDRIPAKLIRRT